MAWYWVFVAGFFVGIGVMAFDLFMVERSARRHREQLWRDLPARLERGLPEELDRWEPPAA